MTLIKKSDQCGVMQGDLLFISLALLSPTHLHARVADGAAPNVLQANTIVILLWQQHQQTPCEHALVPVEVHADGKARDLTHLEGSSPELDKVRDQ